MNKKQLINVFQDTVKRFDDIPTNSVTTKHSFDEIRMTLDGRTPNVSVINSDTVSAATLYSKLGKTCILNMASWKHPGGGVERGAQAQEECLFRCSNLFEIPNYLYPLKSDEGIYTKDAVFIKDKFYQPMSPITVDVVTISAINLKSNHKPEDYEKTMIKKILLMMSLAKDNGCDNIILGAWGCGVYDNDPTTVAKMFRDYGTGDFDNIIYAVINDHNSVGSNYEIFKEVIC